MFEFQLLWAKKNSHSEFLQCLLMFGQKIEVKNEHFGLVISILGTQEKREHFGLMILPWAPEAADASSQKKLTHFLLEPEIFQPYSLYFCQMEG
uniref:Uncharacterized protein n=1 Tax=Rhizophora mucronata TaxID=61149 RepID=A0A2P2KFR3_RHIMU